MITLSEKLETESQTGGAKQKKSKPREPIAEFENDKDLEYLLFNDKEENVRLISAFVETHGCRS